VFLALLLLSLKPVNAAVENSKAAHSIQNKIAIVGILSFQDETDSGAPPELGRKIAQLLKQRLASSFNDIVPKSLSWIDGPRKPRSGMMPITKKERS